MKQFIAFCLIFIFFNCKEKQRPYKPHTNLSTMLDSANNSSLNKNVRLKYASKALDFAKKGNNDTMLFQSYVTQINVLNELGFEKKSLKYSKDLITWSKNHTSKKYLASSYFNLGNFYYEKYNSDSAYYYFNKSKNEYISLNDKNGIAKNSINIGMILNDIASYFESEKSSLEALKLIKNNPKHPYLTPIYNNLAVSSGGLLNYTEELYWYNKALNLTEEPYYIASIKHNQAIAYTLLKQYNEAIKILTTLKNEKVVKSNPDLYARVIDNLAYAKWFVCCQNK